MIKLRCFQEMYSNELHLQVIRRTPYGKHILKMPDSLEWIEIKEGQMFPDNTTIRIPYEWALSGFFDDFEEQLKNVGINTKNQKDQLKKLEGLEAKLEALQAHLQDMRRLVFKGKV
jgi:hypothetical protein